MTKGLEDLKIYKIACELEGKIHNSIKSFPAEEKFRKAGQIARSSSPVCDNIAEGYGKYSYQSKIQSFYVSRGEAEEARSQIERAGNLELLNIKTSKELVDDYTILIKGINGYIRYLRKEKEIKETPKP